MPIGNIRRAQLIAPFGVGAMFTAKSGVSVICCGLDHWFERENCTQKDVDVAEFRVEEWRLQRQLAVSHFRLPPDYRKNKKDWDNGNNLPNLGLTMPVLRFPRFHYCTKCGLLMELSLMDSSRRTECPDCKLKKKRSYVVQVPFVAICEHGHIQDFPWREWVHKSINPACNQKMHLKSTGGASLASQMVSCECGIEPRSLSQITGSIKKESFLSKNLSSDVNEQFTCRGSKPWVMDIDGEGCGQQLRGALRSASNVYFAQVKSSIYIPRAGALLPGTLMEIVMGDAAFMQIVQTLKDVNLIEKITPSFVRNHFGRSLAPFSDAQIETAVKVVSGQTIAGDTENGVCPDDDIETAFRREEYNSLLQEWNDDILKVAKANLALFSPEVSKYFSAVMLIDRLRETRALAGFTRVVTENATTAEQKMELLFAEMPPPEQRWLPAYVVHGEGIFFQFDTIKLDQWEQEVPFVKERISKLAAQYSLIIQQKQYRQRPITPRFVLLHTFAHLIINRLTYECGYSSASLRERLYVSDHPDHSMAGVLIYTAAGDSEGTMGGLVKMGKPGYLEATIRRAVETASWCSADPVCMEMGDKGGQGPDSCNLAACHSCALLPETACEEFNRFLDRGLIVGTLENRSMGYFGSILGTTDK